MITLHHLNNSRSQRILWLMEELNLPYQVKLYYRNEKTKLAPKELKEIHPLGKSPVITDGEITVAESGAVIEYLVQTYGNNFAPEKGSEAFRQYTYWMHFSEGTLMPPLLLSLVFNRIKSTKMPFFIKPIAKSIANKVLESFVLPNIKNNLTYIETHLGQNTWFCGEQLTGADIQMSFPLEAVVARGGAEEFPNIKEYVNRFQSRPAYKKGIEAGGQYDYA